MSATPDDYARGFEHGYQLAREHVLEGCRDRLAGLLDTVEGELHRARTPGQRPRIPLNVDRLTVCLEDLRITGVSLYRGREVFRQEMSLSGFRDLIEAVDAGLEEDEARKTGYNWERHFTYRYVNAQGEIIYTNDLQSVPVAQRPSPS